jgi:glycerol-3-phosphate acyltransferase PlsY
MPFLAERRKGAVVSWIWLGALLAAGYLLGSVSFAIIITRARSGNDIRELGNRNAGTANVTRHLGLGWGALVFVLDVLKGLLPVVAAGLPFFSFEGPLRVWAGFGAGIAVIVGHCLPLYHGFRGGGGIASSLAVYFAFIPVEFSASILLSCLIVLFFVRNVQFRVGRWIPIWFIALAPFLALAATIAFPSRSMGAIPLGGHSWSVVAGVFVVSFLLLFFNRLKVVRSLAQLRGAGPRR